MALRRYERRMNVASFTRTLIAAFALAALAGCAGGTGSADLAPAVQEPPPQAAAPQTSPQATAPPAPAGRAIQSAPAAPPAPARQAALTPEEAKGQCWMKYENDRRAKSIDERLKLVEKCVDDTLRGQLTQRPER